MVNESPLCTCRAAEMHRPHALDAMPLVKHTLLHHLLDFLGLRGSAALAGQTLETASGPFCGRHRPWPVWCRPSGMLLLPAALSSTGKYQAYRAMSSFVFDVKLAVQTPLYLQCQTNFAAPRLLCNIQLQHACINH